MGRAVFFDLDGTLINSVLDVHLCLSEVMEKAGRERLSVEQVTHLVGGGARIMTEKALTMTGGVNSSQEVEEMVADFLALYAADPVRLTKPFPGAIDLLDRLRDQGLTLAICTNKPRATTDPVLDALDLEQYFEMICCGNEVPHQKPDARHIEHMIAELSLNRPDVVMIGDSDNDLLAADAANLRSIMVSFGYDADLKDHPALDIMIDALTEVPAKLDEIWGS